MNGNANQMPVHPKTAIQTAKYAEYAEEQGLGNSGLFSELFPWDGEWRIRGPGQTDEAKETLFQVDLNRPLALSLIGY